MGQSDELIQGVELRYRLYGLDAQARGAIKRIWPVIEPHVDAAVDAIIEATANLPHVANITKVNKELIKKLEVAHLAALLSGDLDGPYLESCRRTVAQEAMLGLDGRFRRPPEITCCGRRSTRLARKYRYSPAKLTESAKLISEVIAFDVANAMTLHRRDGGEGRADASADDRRGDSGFRRRHRRSARSHQRSLDLADRNMLVDARGRARHAQAHGRRVAGGGGNHRARESDRRGDQGTVRIDPAYRPGSNARAGHGQGGGRRHPAHAARPFCR